MDNNMSTYFIGDIHGCYKNLQTILNNIQFNSNIDMLYLTGDLVARGPHSLKVLRWVKNLSHNVKTVLGNHDLHLLENYFHIHHKKIEDSFKYILNAPDIDELMHWLRHQSILHIDEDKKLLMIHAGLHPTWNLEKIKVYAKEIENILISEHPYLLFYNQNHLHDVKYININPKKIIKIQNNVNIFTKIRYIYSNGCLNLTYKNNPENAPKNIYPWFNLSQFINSTYSIIFGHWASLTRNNIPIGFYGLDSGCCWGGHLTALRWEDKKIIHIPCVPPA